MAVELPDVLVSPRDEVPLPAALEAELMAVLVGEDEVVVVGNVVVVVAVDVGESRLVTVSHRPVMGSMIVHEGDREI